MYFVPYFLGNWVNEGIGILFEFRILSLFVRRAAGLSSN
jgi:hypothetical protein